MNTALKRHGWAARWEWLNLNKGYTKYRHGSEPAVSLFKIKPWISVPKKSVIIKISLIFKNLWKSVIICGQKLRGFPCLKKEMLKASGGNVKCLWNGEKS